MENKVTIDETNLDRVAGGNSENWFKIEVAYVARARSDYNNALRMEMTYAVTPEETIESIEQRTIDHSLAAGGTATTCYHGAPVAKDVTMAALGIKEYEQLTMTLELWGGGWGA